MRKAISTRTRFEIFKRDGFTCQYCGATPSEKTILHIDHIVPVSKGGDNSRENLVTSCAKCNMGKSNVPLSSVPQSLAEKAALVKENEKQIKAYQKVFKAKKDRIEAECWEIVNIYKGFPEDGKLSIGRLDFSSIKNFIELLGYPEVEDAMEIACSKFERNRAEKAKFKYFCGICWNKIKAAEVS